MGMDRQDQAADDAGQDPIVIDADHMDRPHRLVARLRQRGRAHLVTSARVTAAQNRAKRQRRYMWIQGVRIPFLMLSAVAYLWWHSIPLAVILFLISVPLPWIAVVVANGVGEPRDRRSPQIYKPALVREQRAAVENTSRRQLTGGHSTGEAPPKDT